MCNCLIPFLAQNDGESTVNLNYTWRQVSIQRMRGMENNILSVAISLISKQKEHNYRCTVDGKCQEITYFSSAMLRQKCSTCISPYYASNYIYCQSLQHT